jgi:hypothetical protein
MPAGGAQRRGDGNPYLPLSPGFAWPAGTEAGPTTVWKAWKS